MILPIIKYGSPVLRKQTLEITEKDDANKIAEDLFDSLTKSGGIGLAAPQIGLVKQIFIIDTTPVLNGDNAIESCKKAYLNPQIISSESEMDYYKESCLSIPGIAEEVARPIKILVKYYDIHSKLIEEELDGLVARIFQHEYDHLCGKLFIDRLSLIRKQMIKNKLPKIKN